MKTLILIALVSILEMITTNKATAQSCGLRISDTAYYVDGHRVSNTTTVTQAKGFQVMDTHTGRTFSNTTLMRMPNRSVNAIVNTVAGVISYGGGTPSIRGADPSGTAYFVDGIRVYGSLPVMGR